MLKKSIKTGEEEKEEFSAEPFAVLYGHESRVTDIAECLYDFAPAICSGK